MSQLLYEVRGHVAVLTLNRPAQLNALDLAMVQELHRALGEAERDLNVDFILLTSSQSKAFCAGGDVKKVVSEIIAGNSSYGKEFFSAEYEMDEAFHRSKKAVVALCDGITMGGGLGLAQASQIRVACRSTRCAMPEVNIGFYPDVGASFFLNKIEHAIGKFLAVTGASFSGADAVSCGLMDFYVDEQDFEILKAELVELGAARRVTKQDVLELLGARSMPQQTVRQISQLYASREEIIACAKTDSHVSFFESLSKLRNTSSDFVRRALQSFDSGSPLSERIVFEQLSRSRKLNVKAALEFDKHFAPRFSEQSDFVEGVRAKLIDKSGLPNWKFPRFLDVPQASVERFFLGTSLSTSYKEYCE